MNSIAKYFTPTNHGRIIRYSKIIQYSATKWWFQIVFSVFIAILVLGPLAFLLYGSLSSAQPGEKGHFTLKNYKILMDARYLSSALNTLISATIASLIASFLGLCLAWIVNRTDTPFRRLFESISIIPFFMSPFFGSLAWVLLASPSHGILNTLFLRLPFFTEPPLNIYSLGGIGFVQGLYFTPFVLLMAGAVFKNMDPSLEEAARAVGCSWFQVFTKISFPMLLPAVMSAFLIAFVRSSEQFGVPAVLGIPKGIYVLSTRIRQEMIIYPPNYMIGAAMGVVLILMMSIAIFIQMRIIGPRQYVTVTGKAYKPKVVALGKWKYLTFSFCLLFFVIAIVLPVGVIIISSLVSRWDPSMPLRSLSFENYKFVLTYPMVFQSIKNSIYIGVVGGFLGTVICFLIAYIVKRSRFFGRKPLEYLAYIPVAVPGIAMGISFLWIVVRLPGILGALYGTIWIMMIAFIARYIAFGYTTIAPAIIQIHPELEESARSFGATFFKSVIKILAPLLKPAFVSCWILLFLLFFRELSCSILLYGPGSELISIAMFDLWYDGWYSKACALGMIQLLIVFSIILFVRYGLRLELRKG